MEKTKKIRNKFSNTEDETIWIMKMLIPQREAQLVSRIALSFPIIADELPHPNPPDRFQALILQFWPKLSITLHSLPDSQSHSKSLSELTLS